MIIVLDTNAFYADVLARKGWLSAIVDGAAQGHFSVVVPETVVRELTRQYPERLDAVAEQAEAAITKINRELRRLGLDDHSKLSIDAAPSDRYETDLRARLSGKGCRIEPDPADMSPIVEWAVQKRAPYKTSGEGAPDATIWLTALNLAAEDEVVLLSTNIHDFGDGSKSAALHPQLISDVRARGHAEDRVRLVASVSTLVETIVRPLVDARDEAARLCSEPPSAVRVRAALENATRYDTLPASRLRLGIDLESDPQVDEIAVSAVEVLSARRTDAGELLMEARALADLELEMTVFRGDAFAAEHNSPVVIVDDDFSQHYVTARAVLTLWLVFEIASNPDATEIEVELLAAERLSDKKTLQRRLDQGADQSLVETVAEMLETASLDVAHYRPPEPLNSDLEYARLERLYDRESTVVESIEHFDEGAVVATFKIEARGDVEWHASAPSPYDVDAYRSLAEGSDGGELLTDTPSSEPLVLLVDATLGLDGDWTDVEVQEVILAPAELERRAAQLDPETEALVEGVDRDVAGELPT